MSLNTPGQRIREVSDFDQLHKRAEYVVDNTPNLKRQPDHIGVYT